jgi:hypothetical protein
MGVSATILLRQGKRETGLKSSLTKLKTVFWQLCKY